MMTRLFLVLCLTVTAWADVATNSSLKGKYFFRQVLMVADGSASVTETRTGFGTIDFDGTGHFQVTGQQLANDVTTGPLQKTGDYVVKPGGYVTLPSPLNATGSLSSLNLRLGTTGLVGSSTEGGSTIFDMFVAIPAPSQAAPVITGPYWISSLEMPRGGLQW